jgi:hypothetical protein
MHSLARGRGRDFAEHVEERPDQRIIPDTVELPKRRELIALEQHRAGEKADDIAELDDELTLEIRPAEKCDASAR